MDPAIAAKKRHLSFERVAELLGIDAAMPPTKSDAVLRESYIASLLEALAQQGATLSASLDDLERRISALEAKATEAEPRVAK